MINKNLTISKTILFTFVKINLQKCFYPGGGNGKKVGEEFTKKVMEKCIGTGCENKMPPQVQKPPQIQKPPTVSPVNSSEKEKKNLFSGITQHNAKEIAKPIISIGENAKKSNKDYTEKNNTENVKKDNSTVNAVLQKHGVNNPILITKQENSNIQAAIKGSNNISTSSTPLLLPPPPKNINVAESSPSSKFVTVQDELVYQKALQKQTSANVNEENLKPSQIFAGKTFSDKPYTTTIAEDTHVKDLSDTQLREELLVRELIKQDDGKTSVEVKLKDDSSVIVGASKHKIKLSSLGQAYTELLPKKSAPLDDSTAVVDFSKIFFPEAKPEDIFIISVSPPSTEDCFIETGKQKHLLIGYNIHTGDYYKFGYFTSKKSGKVISDKQYKAFENEQENKASSNKEKEQKSTDSLLDKNKPQHFVQFKNPIRVKAEEVQIVKYSKEYIQSLPKGSAEILRDAVMEQKGKIPEDFNTKGLTKEDALLMCKEYDKVAKAKEQNPKSKIQHPLSLEQQKNNKDYLNHKNLNKESDD